VRTAGRSKPTPYELVAVCMWSVPDVALVTLVFWLALGGRRL
jgi:hypothetical protein